MHCTTYTELDDAFCGVVAGKFRALFFSVLALFLLLLFDTLIDFFDSFALPLEALLLFDCLESFDFNVEALSINTCPLIVDSELFVCRPDDLAPFFTVLMVGDIFHLV